MCKKWERESGKKWREKMYRERKCVHVESLDEKRKL
jgi:hypothetical protein